MDRIDAMQAFLNVAELKGFAPAARKLGLSASGVTRLIATLEEHLGARLLQRTTRSVALTDAARVTWNGPGGSSPTSRKPRPPSRTSAAARAGALWYRRRSVSGAFTSARS